MQMTRRHQWLLFAAATSAAAAPLAERAIAGVWKLLSDEDPPEDPAGPQVDWGRAILWTAVAAVGVAVTQVIARRGAALAWEHVMGELPPKPKRRKRRRIVKR